MAINIPVELEFKQISQCVRYYCKVMLFIHGNLVNILWFLVTR